MFVKLTKEEFEKMLPDFEIVNDPKSKEIIYQFKTETPNVAVRIYSTVDIRTGVTRDKGKDAIRVVFWDSLNNRPIGKGKKILRTEGATSVGDRLVNRVQEFKKTSGEIEIVDFKYVEAILKHESISWNGFSQSLLESLLQYKRLTPKQLEYVLGEKNPKGKPTFEAQVKAKDANFMDTYLDTLEEEVEDIIKQALDITTNTKEVVVDDITQTQVEEKPKEKIKSAVSIPDDITLIPTSEYKDWDYPFDNFNPVQSAVMPHRTEDNNVVLSANTSAGKTIAAELLMDWVLEHGV
jgi:superfamily II RNA helicase